MPENRFLYHQLYRIRRFEETVLANFPKGIFYGTTHTYLGQEANAVGVLSNIQEGDIVFSNHRCHGHFLVYGGDMVSLFAELMGRETGVCGGRGGSQHLHWRNFYSNGVQGGIVPIATGMALAEKYKNSGAITIAFLGDGTLGEGVVYESLNMAALWSVPILYVLENNRIAQTTPIGSAVSGDIAQRFNAFGIQSHQLETADVLEILPVAEKLIKEVREGSAPKALLINSYRFGPHSKGDDTRDPLTLDEIRREHDPIQIQGKRLDNHDMKNIRIEVDNEVDAALKKALEAPFPSLNQSQNLPRQFFTR
jgi:TPP-dependent pyruvate/acetoin dehydrogenase alpha subunit